MQIEVKKLTDEELKSRGVRNWPIWESPVRTFPWEYGDTELCYIIEGKVIVETEDGEKVEFGAGDFVKFPKGLKCTWKVLEPVRKHYNFE